MIKIPATVEGLEAITEAIGAGHQRQRHADLQPRAAPRRSSTPTSPGSSRPRPPASTSRRSTRSRRSSCRASTPRSTSGSTAIGTDEALALKSKAGVANAQLAYQLFEQEFATERATALLAAGANLQRPLWASTGVKDPNLPDTLYVTELAVARRRQHDAGEDARGHLRPRRRSHGDTVTGAYAEADAGARRARRASASTTTT